MRWQSQHPLTFPLLLLLPLLLATVRSQELTESVVAETQVRIRNLTFTGHELNVSSSSGQHRVFSFIRVPFAQPPTGALRFAPPRPLDFAETVTFNSTRPPRCPRTGGSDRDEDCLYMGIRTPNLTVGANLPVLALLLGPDANEISGTAFVATQQTVVMVTIESRHGVLGYLNANGINSTANIGLQDQRLALEVLKVVIGDFGGDPARVTLVGHGTAAAAAGLQAVSSGSIDLFQRVAMLGGSVASPLAWSESPETSEKLGLRFIENVGCGSGVDVLECLRTKTLEDLLHAESQSKVFVPVFDASDSPQHLWRGGAFNRSLLTGAAADSGAALADEAVRSQNSSWDSVNETVFKQIVENQFHYFPRFPTNISLTGLSFLRLIFTDWPDAKFGAAARPLLGKGIGDFRVFCPVLQAASDIVMLGSPAFVFLLDSADPGTASSTGGLARDLELFLGKPLMEAGVPESHRNLSLVMMQHLANFVVSGSPGGSWPQFSLTSSDFMRFRATSNHSVNAPEVGGFSLAPGRCPLWKHEFPFLNNLTDSFTEAAEDAPQESVGILHHEPLDSSILKLQGAPSKIATIIATYPIYVLGFATLTGHTIKTEANRIMTRFLGVPYANPPVGVLRFAKPQPITFVPNRWINASDAPPLCTQPQNPRQLPMSEDCLYLNIWTPLHSSHHTENLPVIVFIHGGFFQFGGVSEEFNNVNLWDGSKMLDVYNETIPDLVVVTINYRVGLFGFLSLDQDSIPANLGLWDQEEAIKWVVRYIEKFGGSRSKITLMGVEAGAAAIGYHMARPNPGFKRAVLLTGSPYMPFYVSSDTSAVRRANLDFVLNSLNCSTDDTLNCLRRLNETELNQKQTYFMKLYPGFGNSANGKDSPAVLHFLPVIDGDFIKSDPISINHRTNIPLLIGNVDNPGRWLMKRMNLGNFSHEQFLNTLLDQTVSYFPRFPTRPSEDVKKAVKLHFTDFNEQDNVIRDSLTLATAIGDHHFTCANNRFLDDVSNSTVSSVFSFRFDEPTSPEGASLFDDALYAFGNPGLLSKHVKNEARANLSRELVRSIAIFANSGKPTWKSETWPEFSRSKRTTLVIRVGEQQEFTERVHRAQEVGNWDRVLPDIGLPRVTTPTTRATDEPSTEISTDSVEPSTTSSATSAGTDSPGSPTSTDSTSLSPPTSTPTSTDSSISTSAGTDTSVSTSKVSSGTTADISNATGSVKSTTPSTTESTKTTTSNTTGSTETKPSSTTGSTETTPSSTTGSTETTTGPPIGPIPGSIIAVIVVVSIVSACLIGFGIFIIVNLLGKRSAVGPV